MLPQAVAFFAGEALTAIEFTGAKNKTTGRVTGVTFFVEKELAIGDRLLQAAPAVRTC